MMSVNKGKGTKGRSYDELSGVGTSRAGVTGIRDTLSDLRREAALDADLGDTGSMQSADLGESSAEAGSAAEAPETGRPGLQRGSQNR
jgi:hypothetical protein